MNPITRCRHHFVALTRVGVTFFILSIAFAAPNSFGAGPGARTNLIFVLADDLGWAELGCYGNTFNETPNLDRLAAGGMRFTQAYAAAPVCSPFRVSLMTGQWPARVGITDYLRPDDPKHLPTEQVTLAERLRDAGYVTGIIGKWHLTGYSNHGAEEFPPSRQGFLETMVSENRGIGGGSYFFPYHFNLEIERRLPEPEFLVDRCNQEAVEFIERHRDEPFFLYLSHYAVHTKLLGRSDLVAKYSAKPGAGIDQRSPRNNVHLAAQLETIDDGVGRIAAKLDELGLAERTVLVFTSDNGGEDRVTTNAPLRAGKSTLYEGGIREPFIARWPGHVPEGSECTTPIVSIDYYPTFLDLLQVEPDSAQAFDGVSFARLLADPATPLERDALYWHYPLEKPHFLGGRSGGAMRSGDWKLVEDFTTGRIELYDLAHDVGEEHDLAKAMPGKAAALHERLKAWRAEVGAKTMRHAQASAK